MLNDGELVKRRWGFFYHEEHEAHEGGVINKSGNLTLDYTDGEEVLGAWQ